VRVLVVAALVVICLAFALLLRRRSVDQSRPDAATSQPATASIETSSDAAVQAARRPSRLVALSGSLASNKPIELLPVEHPHRSAFAGIFGKRQDAVDACRDHFEMPKLQELLPQSTVVSPYGGKAKEASMRQIVSVEITRTEDGYRVEDAHVVETSLEFPGPDGTLRRVLLADDSLDRCVERAFVEPGDDTSRGREIERFIVQDIAGEAVYDLP
jgi:hypothetical protein